MLHIVYNQHCLLLLLQPVKFPYCRGKLRLHQGPPKVVIHSSNEDISLSIADEMPSRCEISIFTNSLGCRQDDVPQYSSRPSSSLGLHSATPRYLDNNLQKGMLEHLTYLLIYTFSTRSRSPASRRPHSTLPPNAPECSLPPR